MPIWEDDRLDRRRDASTTDTATPTRGASCSALAEALAVDGSACHSRLRRCLVLPLAERRLPANVDPLTVEAERRGGARASGASVRAGARPAWSATCCPLQRQPDEGGRRLGERPLVPASEHLFLIPGDSPIGYRLPLDSLPWAEPQDVDDDPRDRSVRPATAARRRDSWRSASAMRAPTGDLASGERADGARSRPPASFARRCASSRATAALHVFMPPVRTTEDYLDLIAAIEQTAADARACRCIVEGTPPPPDPRLNHFKVTPDPGVIEVNLHPAHSWDELVAPRRPAVRGGAPDAARHREVHARRPAHRHRRRQPHRARRPDAGRQPVPAPARSAAQPARLLAQSSVAVVPVLGPVHRADEPASARRRGAATIRCYELEIAFAQMPERRRVAAVAGGPRVPPSAGRRDRQHAPRRVLHRQALLARHEQRPARAWSSCARSRCRRTRR